MGENVHTARKTAALLLINKEIRLEVNAVKTKYIFISRKYKAGQNHSMKLGNESFESVVKFKCLGTANKSKLC